VRTRKEIERVLALVEEGLNDCQIARATGIPRSTVRNWRMDHRLRSPTTHRRRVCDRCGHEPHAFDRLPPEYVYLLGLYLGDGYITTHARGVLQLHIALDAGYPAIADECRRAVMAVMPTNKVTVRAFAKGQRLSEVTCYSRQWVCLFPQHGPGRKHERDISLERWQLNLLRRCPQLFVRGLLHSDGCRSENVVRRPGKQYRYTRYTFSNRSEDIRRLFCEACAMLGIEWRQMNAWNVSVARRPSVELLDRFVGPKR
jgi:hypothetical protein